MDIINSSPYAEAVVAERFKHNKVSAEAYAFADFLSTVDTHRAVVIWYANEEGLPVRDRRNEYESLSVAEQVRVEQKYPQFGTEIDTVHESQATECGVTEGQSAPDQSAPGTVYEVMKRRTFTGAAAKTTKVDTSFLEIGKGAPEIPSRSDRRDTSRTVPPRGSVSNPNATL